MGELVCGGNFPGLIGVLLGRKKFVETADKIGACNLGTPVVGPPLQTKRPAFAVLVVGPSLSPVARTYVRRRVRKRIWIGKIDFANDSVNHHIEINDECECVFVEVKAENVQKILLEVPLCWRAVFWCIALT